MSGDANGDASPLIVVLGCTGVGKSKLAIELAKRFGGEVINADSMQVYDALPIATNRVTEAEADGIPHHMLGFLAPTEVYHAGRFLEDVLPVLEDIWARGKLAIVVGGTHYYIEALIFKTLIGIPDEAAGGAAAPTALVGSSSSSSSNKAGPAAVMAVEEKGVVPPPATIEAPSLLSGGEKQSLHEMLSEVDPTMARRLHPNDTRKIQRCLDLYRMQGVPRSEQLLQDGKDGDVLRFDRPCCCLWVDCDFSVLDPRLDARIDTMLKSGLLEEQRSFLKQLAALQPPALYMDAPITESSAIISKAAAAAAAAAAAGGGGNAGDGGGNARGDRGGGGRAGHGSGEVSVEASAAASVVVVPYADMDAAPAPARVLDYSKGVLQAIGFKEFAAYFALKAAEQSGSLDHGGGNSSDGSGAVTTLFEECTDKMKRFTRRYAKKQVTWIQRRLMEGPPCKQLYLHKFNASDLAVWDANVLQEAVHVVQAHTAAGATPLPGIARKPKPSKAEALLQWRKYTCEVCNGKVLNGDHEWQAHTKSKAHRNRTKKRKSRIPHGLGNASIAAAAAAASDK